jgi:proteasome accessory factor B
LSRIGAEVATVGPRDAVRRPDGVDLREIVHQAVAEWPPSAQAWVWVANGRATALRRQAAVTVSRSLAGRAGDEIAIDIGRQDRLAREIAGYGADAVVLEPQSLRDDVVDRLRAQAEGIARV